jgi:hypothetical protein
VRFVDTSILLYAISRDPAEQDKAKRANDILLKPGELVHPSGQLLKVGDDQRAHRGVPPCKR